MDTYKWGLSVDIEGFSNQYEYSEELKTKAIMSLHELMKAIIDIGTKVYPGKPENNFSERLFVHQFGDGFIITSDFYEKSSERCVAIAISLMRHMMMKGRTLKVAISTGDMSDINGCYPSEVRNAINYRVNLGRGLMTTSPVMGTALTKSHKLLSSKNGSVIIIDSNRFEEMPDIIINKEPTGICVVDWVNSELPLAKKISSMAFLEYGNKQELLKKFEMYIQEEPIPPSKWINSTRSSWQH